MKPLCAGDKKFVRENALPSSLGSSTVFCSDCSGLERKIAVWAEIDVLSEFTPHLFLPVGAKRRNILKKKLM